MTNNIREYHRPAEVAEAVALLQRAGVSTAPLAIGPRAPDEPMAGVEAVVDLSQLGLDEIKETADGVVHIGAMVSLQSLVDSMLLQGLADGIVAEAALLAAGSAMRHAATVGGALRYARQVLEGTEREGPPELLVVLAALNAEVLFESAEPLGIGAYLAVGGEDAVNMRLITGVQFKRPSGNGGASLARVARTPRDQAIVAAAALVEGSDARLVVAPGGTAPLRLQAGDIDNVEALVNPQSDFRGSAEYKRAMAGVLARRALAEAVRRAGRQ